jgi:hypothetical protein
MKYILTGNETGLPTVELTRRNLLALLAKLDGNPPNSKCTIIDPQEKVAVKAVENEEHYFDRDPGPMHLETEVILT